MAKIQQAGKSLRIFCVTQQQKDLMLRGGIVAGVEVEVTEPRRMKERTARKRGVKKVISGVPPDYTDAELQAASGAAAAARIKKKSQGTETLTSSIILTFSEDAQVPEAIRLKFLKFKLRDYIPSPMRCFKC